MYERMIDRIKPSINLLSIDGIVVVIHRHSLSLLCALKQNESCLNANVVAFDVLIGRKCVFSTKRNRTTNIEQLTSSIYDILLLVS